MHCHRITLLTGCAAVLLPLTVRLLLSLLSGSAAALLALTVLLLLSLLLLWLLLVLRGSFKHGVVAAGGSRAAGVAGAASGVQEVKGEARTFSDGSKLQHITCTNKRHPRGCIRYVLAAAAAITSHYC